MQNVMLTLTAVLAFASVAFVLAVAAGCAILIMIVHAFYYACGHVSLLSRLLLRTQTWNELFDLGRLAYEGGMEGRSAVATATRAGQ